MIIPYSLLIIKPMSVGRGDAPVILQDIFYHCPVALRMFRQFIICDTTLLALVEPTGPHHSTLDYEQEKIHPARQIPSWICVFTHLDRITDPTVLLNEYCGPLDVSQRTHQHLRYTYSTSFHPSDNVVHIAIPERRQYEANLLFLEFNEEHI